MEDSERWMGQREGKLEVTSVRVSVRWTSGRALKPYGLVTQRWLQAEREISRFLLQRWPRTPFLYLWHDKNTSNNLASFLSLLIFYTSRRDVFLFSLDPQKYLLWESFYYEEHVHLHFKCLNQKQYIDLFCQYGCERSKQTNKKDTYTSLWCVYTRSNSASGAIHFTGRRPYTRG